MKAMIVRECGPLENLKLEEVPDPLAEPGKVVIDIKACGVNFADSLMVGGTYQVKPPLPFSPGLEVAGYIAEVGPGVEGWQVGDRVQALTNWGGFAEKVAVPAEVLIRIPENMSFEDAASFVVAYGTSHVALDYRARLKAGEWLVVTGAGGGVGLTAVEIGHLMGARVIALAGDDEKLAVARSKGAEFTVNYKHEDVRDRVKEITEGAGANVVYDAVGGDIFRACFRAMAPEGRMMIIGFASGDVPQVPANHLLVKNIELIGFYWGAYKEFKHQVLLDSATDLFRWYAEGKIKPHISKTFPLEQAVEAIRSLKERKSSGKVVVTM
ncbi:NADPH:quinone oxidoreductase family protein [Luteithermobacter gelatinilyticus]|uniref:NADPH:quinone oxidoreductase family protein n=1 Tax=Luteithermobacter gelatinilyticus TaxID=2582913 RepID=UPI001106F80C|nr:NADPH:quinone oxidoreductase family protein [Luteithermobacter gelatinilyticus]